MDNYSDRRLIENEVLFRAINQRVAKTAAKILNQLPMDDVEMSFYCECSNPACTERVYLPIRRYEEIHRHNMQFIVRPGHDTPGIERVIGGKRGYLLVEKFSGEQ